MPVPDETPKALVAALDHVTAQLRTMKRGEIVGQEDLAWSLPDGSYVEATVVSIEPLVVRLDASKGFLLRRIAATRSVRLDSAGWSAPWRM